MQRLQEIQGPTHELPPIDTSERQFSGRSRLYIGNIGPGVTEDSLKTDLGKYGEVGEMFYNSEKHFAFLRMDYRENAEKAKREMDGKMVSGRPMKVRFAPHQGALKVKNLGPWVSNELLHRAFSCFGDLERAFVMVDDRGRSKGEGVVEYERKPSALDALRRCSEGAFFLTASLRPVIVELMEEADDEDGLMDKALPKRNQEFGMEREMSKRQRPFSPRPVLSTCIGSSSDSVSSRHPLPARQYLPNVSMFLAAQSSLGGCLDPDVPVSLKKYCQTTIISVLCTILKEQTVLKIHVNSSLKCVSSLLIEKVMLSRTPLYLLIAEACLPPK